MLSQRVNLPSFGYNCSILRNSGDLQGEARVEMQTCFTWEFGVGPGDPGCPSVWGGWVEWERERKGVERKRSFSALQWG